MLPTLHHPNLPLWSLGQWSLGVPTSKWAADKGYFPVVSDLLCVSILRIYFAYLFLRIYFAAYLFFRIYFGRVSILCRVSIFLRERIYFLPRIYFRHNLMERIYFWQVRIYFLPVSILFRVSILGFCFCVSIFWLLEHCKNAVNIDVEK